MEAPLDLKAIGGGAIKEETTNGAVGGPNLQHPFPVPQVTVITTEALQEHSILAVSPSIPPQLKASAMPPVAEETYWDRLHAQLKKPSVIFNNDNRTLFIPQGYPWQCVGKVVTAGGWGSGTVVGPRHILTASHVVNWQPDGSAGWITFTPGYYDGRGNSGELAVNEVISWEKAPKFLTDQQVAFDYVILITNVRIGETLGTVGTRAYDASWNKLPNFQAIGYPAEISGGQRPAIQTNSSIQTKEDHTLNGNTGSCLGNFNDFTPGQSGGPVWGWWSGEVGPSAVGVGSIIGTTNVANPGDTSSDNDYAGGDALLKIVKWAKTNRP